MSILNFLWEWRFVIVLAVAFIIFCLFEWERAKSVLYALMLQAKRMAKDAILKSGLQQEEWVVNNAYQFLPKSITIFISRAIMQKMVHWLYHTAKDYLDNGKLDNSI